MNHEARNKAADVEARLERSLRNQIKVPRLDGSFDAAVWSRIADEGRAAQKLNLAPPRVVDAAGGRTPRWLMLSNLIGIAVAILLTVLYVVRAMSGVELPADLGVSMPRLSTEQQLSMLRITGAVFSLAALAFGLRFTKIGRWLLSEFR
jgi:hypothetical protein